MGVDPVSLGGRDGIGWERLLVTGAGLVCVVGGVYVYSAME